MKKPISKWIKAIVVLLITGLFYTVYFTELGKPPPQNEPPMTFYNQTAVPTIFAQWSPVPIVELDWAYASQNLLKFAIKIQNLEANMNPTDWVCNPYIKTAQPVVLRLSGYQITPIYDISGKVIQLIYEYEMQANTYDSLTIDMDITIGPCADHWDSQEFGVTALELVGNYHLSFQAPIKISTPFPSETLTPRSTAIVVWRNIPVYPGAWEVKDDLPGYRYSVDKVDPHTVMLYYRNEMRDMDWELLAITDMSGTNVSPGYTLSFTRGSDILQIDIFVKEKTTHVLLNRE